MLTSDPLFQQFKCPICGWSNAESERKYKNHLWKHKAEKQHKCDQCNFLASSQVIIRSISYSLTRLRSLALL